KHLKLILILLLIASFSRAAYIAFIIGILYKKYHSQTKKYYKNIIKYISIPIIIIMAYYIISYLYKSDLSFQSKFYIIDLAINVFKKFPIYNKIFGIGFLEWQDVLGIYTHNIYITYFIQTGFIGLILFILFVISTFKYAKYIWIPILLVSLSFFSYLGMPFLFVPLAIICNIYDNYMEKRKYYENSIYYSLA
ncbi:MAG: O-antigen ligase family protein, partial [Rectinema subterraneum]